MGGDRASRKGRQAVGGTATADEDVPAWWPYAPEFPHWHVWKGVAGLLYARRPRTSPPKVARAKDVQGLRERIIAAEKRRP